MKKIFKTLPLVLIMMSIYSCTSDDETVQDVNDISSVVTTFTCTQENDGTATKAALDSDCKTILWKTGDAISIFDGAGNKQFTLKAESDGQKSGSFTGECNESESYVAVYPYTAGATLNNDGTVSNIVLPDEQNAVAGGFDPKAALMIAKGETTTLQFKNAVGFIKVTPQFDCKKIILRAADKTKPLAGKGKIKFDGSDPCIDFTGSDELSYSITLSGTITSGNAYYIAVPAVTLSANWTLTFVTDNKNYMRQVTNAITFVRSKAWNLGEFTTGGNYWVGSNGIVNSNQEVDLGLTITGSDNKKYKVIFANANLTTTGLATNEYDYGDYFAWGATEPWYSSATQTWKDGKSEGGYTPANTPFYNGTSYTKYTTAGYTLEASDDAANVILGGDWQIPTIEIWQALVNNSSSKVWDSTNKGYKFPNNSQTLFLPAAGYVEGTTFYENGSSGKYWSGTASANLNASDYLYFGSIKVDAQCHFPRHYGFSVRPVRLVELSAATTEEYNVENDFEW